MTHDVFSEFFQGGLYSHLITLINLALDEDGPDLTSDGIFSETDRMRAVIIAKQDTIIAGLPVIPIVLNACIAKQPVVDSTYTWESLAAEGQRVRAGDCVATITGAARHILKAERVILNFVSRLSGIATMTRSYADALNGTGVKLLDTRKTLPGMRGPDKYGVRMGGGMNHRLSLHDMLLVKDNHIDAAGSITDAVTTLRASRPGLPIEVECRTHDDVREAVACKVERVMLDNMKGSVLAAGLELVPPGIEVEISGNVTLGSIRDLALASTRRPEFISVGRITHSINSADLSMRIEPENS